MKRRRLPHLGWFLASLAVLLIVLVPVGYFAVPHVRRWHMLEQLEHLKTAAPAKREQALSYLIRHADDDSALLDGAIAKLRDADRDTFIHLSHALDLAGVWDHEHIPLDAWLRWLAVIGEADDVDNAGSRIFVAQQTVELAEHADDPRLAELLGPLLNDDEPNVRYNALIAAAELTGIAEAQAQDSGPYEAMIAEATADAEPKIARHAWLLLGLLDPASGYSANWRSAAPEVAEAILWAVLHTNPYQPAPALEALRDERVAPSVRATAVYALHQSDTPAARQVLTELIRLAAEPADQVTADNQVLIWRAVLAAPETEEAKQALHAITANEAADQSAPDPLLEPIVHAARYRLAGALLFEPADDDPDPDALRSLLLHEEPAMRDLACVVAADRLSETQQRRLIRSLLTDLNPLANQSGAILAGLTGLESELLAQATEAEDEWSTKVIMRLGRWMQDELPEMNDQAVGLLVRPDLPQTTLLLALLHRQPTAALDFLLAPRGEPSRDLVELLAHRRWWYVLRRALPDDAPPFWLWADEELQRFQIEVLREWYVLKKQEIQNSRTAGSSEP